LEKTISVKDIFKRLGLQ